jgi:tetratricopeptide (TPR) repeat protein
MFGGWRLQLRAATDAYQRGRLEEASRLLTDGALRDFLPAKRLLAKVAQQLVERGEARIERGQSMAGWRDLDAAARLDADDARVGKARERMLAKALGEVEHLIAAGDYAAALDRLAELDRRRMGGVQLRRWREVAQRMAAAQRLARGGQFVQAEQELAAALPLAEQVCVLQAWIKDYRNKGARFRELSQRLFEALAGGQWNKALEYADAILAIAPEEATAREARRRAWQAVDLGVSDKSSPRQRHIRLTSARMSNRSQESSPGNGSNQSQRFLIWVDEVGAYLVCMGDEIVLGQPGPGSRVDVPLMADLSRVHAKIRRAGEGYLLDPIRGARLDGKLLTELAPLTDGSVIELGTVRLKFRTPHPLSTTARLEIVSRHRTQPSASAVILMGDVCLLGPDSANHVVCPQWSEDIVLHRRGEDLVCRVPGVFLVDGVEQSERAELARNSRISGPDFSFALEPL